MTHGTQDSGKVSAQVRGETVAYAVQNIVSNLAANFYEPYINYRIQRRYARNISHNDHYGTYSQNLIGEFAGDLVGSSTLILGEAICPEQLHTFTRAARKMVDPLYTSVAHAVFAGQRNEPGYDQKVEQWKTFQERNLIRSGIILTTGIAGNLATQKWIVKNESPMTVVFLGKLATTALTTALGLTMRFILPEQTKGLDRWMGDKIAPLMDDVQVSAEPGAESKSASYVERLNQQPSLGLAR